MERGRECEIKYLKISCEFYQKTVASQPFKSTILQSLTPSLHSPSLSLREHWRVLIENDIRYNETRNKTLRKYENQRTYR